MVRRLLILNGIAVIFAVAHHAIPWVLTAMYNWTDRYRDVIVPNYDLMGGFSYQVLRTGEQIFVMAVPAFLLVSGFFGAVNAGKTQRSLSWKMPLKRILTLVIPYLIWSGIILIFRMLEGARYTLLEIFEILVRGQAVPPYYYVPLLVQLLLLSPLLVPLIRKYWPGALVLAALIQLFIVLLRYGSLLDWDFVTASPFLQALRDWHLASFIFWYVFGVFIGFELDRFTGFVQKMKPFLLVSFLFLFILSNVEWELLRQAADRGWISPYVTFSNHFFTLVALLIFFAYDKVRLPASSQIQQLGVFSYGIYLMHVLVLEITARGMYHVSPLVLSIPLLFFLILFVAGLGLPYMFIVIFDRSPFKRFHKYAFG